MSTIKVEVMLILENNMTKKVFQVFTRPHEARAYLKRMRAAGHKVLSVEPALDEKAAL